MIIALMNNYFKSMLIMFEKELPNVQYKVTILRLIHTFRSRSKKENMYYSESEYNTEGGGGGAVTVD